MQDHHFQIVEYERRYAKSIADMWNRSMDSWGGSSKIRTEESIIQEHESSTNLHVFLALAEGEVVGYCSFSHYRNDQGALYIPLLNVRPDYHGKKVGRELILHSVRKTIEMGWPRLDLFTWAGNTKAVPLYKKCGFFWEKRENSTHLMNFIPTVLQSEALMPYFEQIDWYNDLKRNLEIRPDGEKVNGFDLFQYEWEYEGGQQLRVQFEKTGRGIRLIETEDYMIHTDIESHELVFGRSYTVRYMIRNKTGKPLHCVVKGLDDKNVRFSFEASVEVTDEAIVEGKFTIEPVAEEQNDWKTHPAVASDWLINGQSVQFRSGILPKFPATIAFTAPEEESFMQVTKDCYITLKNECKQPALFEFTIPQSDLVEFAEYTHRLSLPAGGQQTISIPYRLYDYGLYSANLSVTASMESGEQISFEKRIDCIFKGQTGLFGGETEQQWAIVNGLMTVYLNKSNNDMWTHHFKDSYNTWWMYPRLGRPYSSEFSLQKASDVNIFKEEQNIVMQAYYDSLDFPGLIFISITKLSANGLIEHYFEVENIADVETGDEVYLNESFYHSLDKGVLPYEGEFFNLEKENVRDSDYWNIDHISENWLFSNGSHLTRGFCWHPSQKLVKSDWHFAIEHSLGKLSAGQKVRTHSTFLAIGTFTDWFDFRSFAQKKREQVKPALSDHLELMVNSGNPIVSDGFSVEVKDRKTSYLDGEIAVCSSKDLFTTQHKRVDTNEQTRSINFDVLLNTVTSATDIVRMSYNASHLQCERNKVVFITSSDALCTSNMTEDEGREVYSVDNGAIRYRACATYGHGLFSLQYNGQEWLDSSYPEPGPKSWWNPYIGGIYAELQGISALSMLQEERSVRFASLSDSKGNVWQGLSIRTLIEKYEKLRGLELVQYFLNVPGVPLLCCVNVITNGTGKVLPGFSCENNDFFSPDEDIKHCWIRGSDKTLYKSGKAQTEIKSGGVIQYGSDRREDTLLVVTNEPERAAAFTNNKVVHHFTPDRTMLLHDAVHTTKPMFYMFHDSFVPYSSFQDLLRITFKN